MAHEAEPKVQRTTKERLNRAAAYVGIVTAPLAAAIFAESANATHQSAKAPTAIERVRSGNPNLPPDAYVNVVAHGIRQPIDAPFLGAYIGSKGSVETITHELSDLKQGMEYIKHAKGPQELYGAMVMKAKPGHDVMLQNPYETWNKDIDFGYGYILGDKKYPVHERVIFNPLFTKINGKTYVYSLDYFEQSPTDTHSYPHFNDLTDDSAFNDFLKSLAKAKDGYHTYDTMNYDEAFKFDSFTLSLHMYDWEQLQKDADISYWQNYNFKPRMVKTTPSTDGKSVVLNDHSLPPSPVASYDLPRYATDHNMSVAQYLKFSGYKPAPGYKPPVGR